jgi:hypothetical protein
MKEESQYVLCSIPAATAKSVSSFNREGRSCKNMVIDGDCCASETTARLNHNPQLKKYVSYFALSGSRFTVCLLAPSSPIVTVHATHEETFVCSYNNIALFGINEQEGDSSSNAINAG